MARVLDNYIEYLDKYLISGQEFNQMIQTIIDGNGNQITGLEYTFKYQVGNLNEQFVFGLRGEGNPEKRDTIKIGCQDKNVEMNHFPDHGNSVSVTVEIWQKGDDLGTEEALNFFKTFWNVESISYTLYVAQIDQGNVRNKCDNTLKRNAEEKKSTAFFMIDIDGFKKANDCGHEKGDRELRTFVCTVLKAINGRAILVHRSGDEFYVIYEYKNPVQVVALGENLKKAVSEQSFSHQFTISMGIWLQDGEKLSTAQAADKAERMYKPRNRNMEKQRDSIRIGKRNNSLIEGEGDLKTSVSRIISNLIEKNIFHNIFLDYVVDKVQKMDIMENFQNEICGLFHWINPKLENNSLRCSVESSKWDTEAIFSVQEFGLAVFCGIMRNTSVSGKFVKLILGGIQNCSLQILLDRNILFELDNQEHYISDEIEVEMKVPGQGIINIKNSECFKKAVLVQAGYDKIEIPQDMFYKVIRVDVRPKQGGGLPDLWSVTLSELITATKENPNIIDIIVCGDTKNTPAIKEYLKKINCGANQDSTEFIPYLARKTYRSEHDILNFQIKYKQHIYFLQKDDIIEHLYLLYTKNAVENLIEVVHQKNEKKFILNRNLVFEDIQLGIDDGCRADSLSDAYPKVLEILRNQYRENKFDVITDQSGRKLLELTNFKVKLCVPRKNDLPEYYEDDKAELDAYYTETFEKKDSLFRKYLEDSGQIDMMLKHVKTAISNPENRYATRRAILIISNNNKEMEQYSPLGLVSIWLAPRLREESIVIDFSYTWRTVEAIVGLPYSLYASVKFSDYLTDTIKKYIGSQADVPEIRMGQISYMANSLHMFLDKEILNITRGIVNDASI